MISADQNVMRELITEYVTKHRPSFGAPKALRAALVLNLWVPRPAEHFETVRYPGRPETYRDRGHGPGTRTQLREEMRTCALPAPEPGGDAALALAVGLVAADGRLELTETVVVRKWALQRGGKRADVSFVPYLQVL